MTIRWARRGARIMFGFGCCALIGACGDARRATDSDAVASVDGIDEDSGAPADTAVASDSEDLDDTCSRSFVDASGTMRGELAADFSLSLVDGDTFVLHAVFTGCESVVVVGDTFALSALDAPPVWESEDDLAALVRRSPDDVHYVFVARGADSVAATARIEAMGARVAAVVATLDEPARAHWRAHLHVASLRAEDITSWVGSALRSQLQPGFAIDHAQVIRGVGSLADVTRPITNEDGWPWRSNLAYLAHEAIYMRAESERRIQARVQARGHVVREVAVWSGEVLSEFAEADVVWPDGLADFDSLTIEVTQRCPDPTQPEWDSCGAWDYLASLTLVDPDDSAHRVELARFITAYHRETHWVVDATPALALLQGSGGHLRWDFAPSWNTQPTATWLTLRFSNLGKGVRPSLAIPLYQGGDFGSAYNDAHAPLQVDIPADAKQVKLWALISGHGAGTSQCAEFCAHQHWFEINGTLHIRGFPEAGTPDGCIAAIREGMTPNQLGTWWFGRGGWCPGAPVAPWLVDVSDEVVAGQPARVAYHATLAGQAPSDGSGNIVMSSFLVIYR